MAQASATESFCVQFVDNGETYSTRSIFTPSSTVRELKQHLADTHFDVGVDHLGLVFQRKSLGDSDTLKMRGINGRIPIHVTFRVTGGGLGPRPEDDLAEQLRRLNLNEKEPLSKNGLSFEKESLIKKQYYSKVESFATITENDVDNQMVNDTNPHFVLTLDNLQDLKLNNDDDNKQIEGNNDEMETLKELQTCLRTGKNHARIELIREKLGRAYGADKNNIVITDIFYGTTNIGYYIWDYAKKKVKEIVRNVETFLKKVKMEFTQFTDMILSQPIPSEIPDSTDGSYHVVKSYHVSCASSKKNCNTWECNKSGHDLGGVVLYMKDGKTDWYCNGRHCKIGYIIVKPSDEVKKSHYSSKGAIHGSVYKSVFNQEVDASVVGSGFGRKDGEWRWNSGVFNCKSDEWHDSKSGYSRTPGKGECEVRTMNEIEQKWIRKAVEQWFTTGRQNLKVTESIVIFKDQ